MKSEFELLQAVQAIEDDLPGWMAAFDSNGLRNVMHRHYDELMSQTPKEMQDRLHDKLRALMVRAGVVRVHFSRRVHLSRLESVRHDGSRASDLEWGRYPHAGSGNHPDS